VNIKKKNSKV